jgi:hypothetical protein
MMTKTGLIKEFKALLKKHNCREDGLDISGLDRNLGCISCTDLIHCTGCTNCTNCNMCIDCVGCTNCVTCVSCTNCTTTSVFCVNLKDKSEGYWLLNKRVTKKVFLKAAAKLFKIQ